MIYGLRNKKKIKSLYVLQLKRWNMRLKLENLYYTTDNPNKILELQELGAEIVDGEVIVDEDKTKLDDKSNLENLKVEELEKLCDEKGIDRSGATKKAELIELLK